MAYGGKIQSVHNRSRPLPPPKRELIFIRRNKQQQQRKKHVYWYIFRDIGWAHSSKQRTTATVKRAEGVYIIIVNECGSLSFSAVLRVITQRHSPSFFSCHLLSYVTFGLVFCCLFHEVDPSLNLVGILARLILIMAGTPCKELGSKLDNSVVIFLQSRKYPQTRENTLLTHSRANCFFIFFLLSLLNKPFQKPSQSVIYFCFIMNFLFPSFKSIV